MRKTSAFIFISLVTVLLMLILSINFASANTLVGGTIYDSNYNHPIKEANIVVWCGSDDLYTNSSSDGTYAVIFDTESCDISSNVKVTSSKDNLYGEVTSIINNSTKEGEEFAIANINMKVKESTTTSSGRQQSSGRVYLCGNGLCDSGETSNTCIRDCPLKYELLSYQNASETPSELITLEQNTDASENTGITGAVTGGTGKTKPIGIIIISLLLLVIIFFVIKKLYKKQDLASDY